MLRGPLEPTSSGAPRTLPDDAGWAILFRNGSLIGPVTEDDARTYASSPSARIVRWYDADPP